MTRLQAAETVFILDTIKELGATEFRRIPFGLEMSRDGEWLATVILWAPTKTPQARVP